MSARLPSIIYIAIIASCVKLLFLPAPHSTDLEVHRHWKALTYNLPLSRWYTDASSTWTLDYPPLFAYFELLLAHLLSWVHPHLLQLSNHNYAPPVAVSALRLTVLACDPLLLSAVVSMRSYILDASFVLLNPALIIVDNIHFQYNILPIALVLHVLAALDGGHIPLAAAIFTLVVNLKHIFLPLSLPLICHVLATLPHLPFPFLTFIRTSGITLLLMCLIWAPFAKAGGLPLLRQIFARLFPFDRGLLHANWAPSFWALYAVIDKILTRFGFAVRIPDGSVTSGVIGTLRPFATLPNPTPAVCNALLAFACTPAITHTLSPLRTKTTLARAVASTALAYTLFGWHVHEKALLIPLQILAATACQSHLHAIAFSFLSPAAHVAVLDLVAGGSAAQAARMLSVAYHTAVLAALSPSFPRGVRRAVVVYTVSGAIVELYAHGGGHAIIFGDKMPFVPLIVTALYSLVGVSVAFVTLCFGTADGREREE